MKVLLVDPPSFRVNRFTAIVRLPSSALLALNTHLLSTGHEVRIVDARNRGIPYSDIGAQISDFGPDIVCVTGFTADAYSAMMVCEVSKKVLPTAVTIMGGYHASALPELTIATCKAIDVVVIGEGENTLQEILSVVAANCGLPAEKASEIPGLAYRSGRNSVERTIPRRLIDDIDSLSPGRYDNVETGYYDFPIRARSSRPARGFLISASRGCVHACHYCSNQLLWNRTWRSYTPERIIQEIGLLTNRHGKDTIFMCDNDFFTSRERIVRFLDLLEAGKIGIRWSVETSTNHIIQMEDLLPRMRSLGLFLCFVGIEFASAEKLGRMGKGAASLDRSHQAAKILRENGIFFVGLGMVGTVDETPQSVLEHVRFFRDLDADMAYTQVLTPLPGTRLFRDMLEAGRISSLNFSHYDLMTPTLVYDHLSVEQVSKLHAHASEALFTPGFSKLYESYRCGTIDADELIRRYAAVAYALDDYDRGELAVHDLLGIYSDVVVGMNPVMCAMRNESEPLETADRALLVKRLETLDSRANLMNPNVEGPASRQMLGELANLISLRFPRQILLKMVRSKRKRNQMANLWLDMMCPEKSAEDVARFIEAEKWWKNRTRELLRVQNRVVAAHPEYLRV